MAPMRSECVGDTVVLDCPVEGRELMPGFTVTWDRASGFLPRDRVRFICGNRSLVLIDTETPDVDIYSCTVLEPSGRTFQFEISLSLFGECPCSSFDLSWGVVFVWIIRCKLPLPPQLHHCTVTSQ